MDTNLTLGRIFNSIRQEVGDDLGEPILISKDHRKFCGKIHNNCMTIGLRSEAFRQMFNQKGDGNVGQMCGQTSCLQA